MSKAKVCLGVVVVEQARETLPLSRTGVVGHAAKRWLPCESWIRDKRSEKGKIDKSHKHYKL